MVAPGESLRTAPSSSFPLSPLFVSNSQVRTFLTVHQTGWGALGLLVTSSMSKTQALASCRCVRSAHDLAAVLLYGTECSVFLLPKGYSGVSQIRPGC